MEHKNFAFEATDVDLEEGYIKGFCAVMGNEDDGADTIPFGAFRKTIAERGLRIKGGWQHDLDMPFAATRVIREVPRQELPAKIVERAPGATGGLYVEGKVSMNSLNRDRLQLVKDGLVDEMSIGYVPVQERFIKTADGRRVRELSEVKLFEWSCVTLGMNPAAQVIEAKRADTAAEPAALETKADDAPAETDLATEQQDADLAGQAIDVVTRLIAREASQLGADEDECAGIYTLLQVRSALVGFAAGETAEAMGLMSGLPALDTKAGRRNSTSDQRSLMAAHDHLHDVIGMPKHDAAGIAEADDTDGDEKSSIDAALALLEARARAAAVIAA